MATAPETFSPYEWAERYGMIAHGLGAVKGITITDSREAFERNYARGYRVFEVDFLFTSDGRIAARHDWGSTMAKRLGLPTTGAVPTFATFKATRMRKGLTPIGAADIVDLMKRHPDAYVMTDFKDSATSAHVRAVQQILDAGGSATEVRRRLIVQIYQESDLAPLRKLGIANVVYTFYRLKTSVARALDFAQANGVRVITIPVAQASATRVKDIVRRHLLCAVHTVNDSGRAAALRKLGVKLLYSDGLAP